MPEKITPAMVYELLGQSIYICNSIELRVKFLLLYSGCGIVIFKTPEDLVKKMLEVRQKKINLCKQPLGVVWKEVLELIYKVPTNKEFDEAEAKASKAGMNVSQLNVNISKKGLLKKVQKMMAAIIDHRNFLAHHFAAKYDLNDPESCKAAYAFLSSKMELLTEGFKRFDADSQSICQVILKAKKAFTNEQITKFIAEKMSNAS